MVSLAGRTNHYEALGLKPGASDQEIEQAFRDRALQHLRDADGMQTREAARQLGIAYEALRDPQSRRAYDETIGFMPGTGDASRGEPAPAMSELFLWDTRRQASPLPGQQRSGRGRMIGARHLVLKPFAATEEDTRDDRASPTSDESSAGILAPLFALIAGRAIARSTEEEPATSSDGGEDVHDPHSDLTEETGALRPPDAGRYLPAAGAMAIGLAIGLAAYLTLQPNGEIDNGGGVDQEIVDLGRSLVAGPPVLVGETAAPPALEPIPPVDERSFLVPQPSQQPVSGGPQPTEATAKDAVSQTAAEPPPAFAAGEAQPATEAQGAANPPAANETVSGQPVAPIAEPARTATRDVPPPALQPSPVPQPQRMRVATSPVWVSGGLANRDNPGGRYEGTVSVRFTVGANGRVSECRPIVSSGDAELDTVTCGLVERRLRFNPALDPQGRPVATEARPPYSWARRRRR